MLFVFILSYGNFAQASSTWTNKFIRGRHLKGITSTLRPALGVVSPCAISSLEILGLDPILGKKRPIEVALFHSLKKSQLDLSNTPSIIIMPPSGGDNVLDTLYAHLFCENGFNVYILRDWFGNLSNYELDPRSHDEEGLRGYSAVLHLLEFIKPASPEKIGLLGTSKGAIQGSLLMALEDELRTSILIAGGADLPRILAVGTHSEVAKIRKKRMEKYKLASVELYEALLRQELKLDPGPLFAGYENKNMLFYIGQRDTTVPTSNQLQLQNLAIKGGAIVESYAYDAAHTRTILAAFTNGRDRFLRFFKEFVY
jgi:hypothetical protein